MPLTIFGSKRASNGRLRSTAFKSNLAASQNLQAIEKETSSPTGAPSPLQIADTEAMTALGAAALINEIPTPCFQLDSEGTIHKANRAAEQLLSCNNQLNGKTFESTLVREEDVARWRHYFSRVVSGEFLRGIEWELRRPKSDLVRNDSAQGDSTLYMLCDFLPLDSGQIHNESVPHQNPGADGALLVCVDITSQRHAEAALKEVESKFHDLLENSTVGLFTCASDGHFLHVNPALAHIFGYDSPAEFLQQQSHRADSFYVDGERYEEYSRLLEEEAVVREFESRVYGKEDRILWIEENVRPISDSSGNVVRYEGTIQDITRRKDREAHLLRHAFHDKLTGLPDRALFLERVNRCMKRRARRPNYWFGVLFLDLDRFKIVNDSLGHVIGDQLLISTARKLESCLRPGDTVARLGGDEFAILLDDIKDVGDATHVAERVLAQLSIPSVLDGHEIYTTSSIGIALISNSYERSEDLLRDADMAMYRAKALGKARYAVFDSAMYADGKNLLQLEADLRHAVLNHEFRVEYQPIVNLNSGRIEGFEAFLRWNHPRRGLVPPSEFVPVAEETGLLVGLDRWVLGEASRQMFTWQSQFPTHSLLTMSVNLSSRQFAQSDLIDELQRIIRRSSLSPRCLRIEMTERSLLANPDAAEATILQMKKLGVQLSLDDFGTGYSSLSHLHRFSFDALKVDRSFVSRMDSEKNDEIVSAIITIAHNLNISVIAEGVETAEQLARLRALNCHYGQGYLFSGPLDSGAARELVLTKPQW